MCAQEQINGNYCKFKCRNMRGSQRKGMVLLMEELWRLRDYRLETLYLSVSIADNYLMKLATTNQKAPCLVTLGMTCLFLAAKL